MAINGNATTAPAANASASLAADFAACFSPMPDDMSWWTGLSVAHLAAYRVAIAALIERHNYAHHGILDKLKALAGVVVVLYRYSVDQRGYAVIRNVLDLLDGFAGRYFECKVVNREEFDTIVAQV